MRYTQPLDRILGQKSKVKALRYLVNYKKEISIRELAREINLVPANLSAALKDLESEGVLVSKKYGRSLVFSLNRNHYLAEAVVIPLFEKEKNAKDELKKLIFKNINFKYESIILFGSIKTGQERPQSDIDIAFIVKDNDEGEIEDRVLEMNETISRRFGNSLSPVIMGRKNFISKLKNKDKFVRALTRDGEVIAGKSISELL